MARKLLVASTALAAMLGLAVPGGIAAANVTAGPTTATVISTAKNGKVGTILVAEHTVYALKPSKTACTAECLKVWLPVVLPKGVMSATAGTGVDASNLGTVAAPDGALQVTYAGKALYWYSKDKAPGQVKGNVTTKWGKWSSVVKPKSSSKSDGSNGDTNAGNGGIAF